MAKYITIDFPLATTYVDNWGTTEAIRELFQNALDSEGEMDWLIEPNTFTLISKNTVIPRKSLLMGYSNKPDNSIGRFGEGYKLACLVLLRQNKTVSIETGKEIWEARIKKSRKFGENILSFRIHKAKKSKHLRVSVTGITKDEWGTILKSNLHLTESSKYGISKSMPGDIFVNGLFVCHEEELKFGYNFKPNEITLDRDRRMIRNFDLLWATSQLWIKEIDNKPEEFVELLKSGYSDVRYVNSFYARHDIVKEAFIKEHGEKAIPISNQAEAEYFKGYKTVIVNETHKGLLTDLVPVIAEDRSTPTQVLEAFYEEYDVDADFENIIKQSMDWRIK